MYLKNTTQRSAKLPRLLIIPIIDSLSYKLKTIDWTLIMLNVGFLYQVVHVKVFEQQSVLKKKIKTTATQSVNNLLQRPQSKVLIEICNWPLLAYVAKTFTPTDRVFFPPI